MDGLARTISPRSFEKYVPASVGEALRWKARAEACAILAETAAIRKLNDNA